jgi:hypothetical protein
MGWREIVGLPADRHPARRHLPPGADPRAGSRPATDTGQTTRQTTGQRTGRPAAGAGGFRPGDVDECPDGGPSSRGAFDERTGPGGLDRDRHAREPAEPTSVRGGTDPARAQPSAPGAGALPAAEQPVDQPAARASGGAGGGRELAWRFPPQQVVASYETHGQAARAVDHLADHRFPVERTAIVGRGLTSVESIGRMSWRDSTLRTVGAWATAGALLGWILGLLDWASPLRAAFSLALWGLLFGGVLGLAGGLLVRAFAGDGHPARVTHTQTYRADSYDLLVDSEVAERARSMLVLGGFPVTGAVRQDAALSGGLRVGDPSEPGRAGSSRRS